MLIENNHNDNQSGFYLTNPKILDATAQKMKFSIKDYFNKWDQIRRKLRIWSHIRKKSWMENFIYCAVCVKGRSTVLH